MGRNIAGGNPKEDPHRMLFCLLLLVALVEGWHAARVGQIKVRSKVTAGEVSRRRDARPRHSVGAPTSPERDGAHGCATGDAETRGHVRQCQSQTGGQSTDTLRMLVNKKSQPVRSGGREQTNQGPKYILQLLLLDCLVIVREWARPIITAMALALFALVHNQLLAPALHILVSEAFPWVLEYELMGVRIDIPSVVSFVLGLQFMVVFLTRR